MFYKRLKKSCAERSTTVTSLLKKLNLPTSHTGNWKRGILPNGEILIKLSKNLNVTTDYLLGRENNENEKENLEMEEKNSKFLLSRRKKHMQGYI